MHLYHHISIGKHSCLECSVTVRQYSIIGEFCRVAQSSYLHINSVLKSHAQLPLVWYEYTANPVPGKTAEEDSIRLGCHIRLVTHWEADWDNNQMEFPIGSKKWKKRKWAYNTCKEWLKVYRS